MKTALFIFALLFSSLILFSCKKDNPIPPEDQPQVNFTLEDVSCTEAWIKLSTSNISLPADVNLYKDSSFTETIKLITADTVLYVDSLLPNQSYSLRAIIQSSNQSITSNVLPVSTMDTTSHNFTWQTWTFGGQAGSCALYDVAIVDENDIWAVGEIYLLDTTGVPDPNAYNTVHWDGNDWKLLRLQFYSICGQPSTGSYPAESIIAFGENDIWITSGSQITHFDGVNQLSTECVPVSVNKLWGTDDNNIYAVGKIGKVAHYQNGQWSRIESGTDANINDIWGIKMESTKQKLFCAIPSGYEPSKRRILTINETDDIDSIHWIGKVVTSIWTNNRNIIYTSGDGIYNNKTGIWKGETSVPFYYTNRIRGNNLNDIVVCGNYGFLAHYNGISWYVYSDFLQISASVFYSIAFKNNIIVSVGFDGEMAYIVMGKRN